MDKKGDVEFDELIPWIIVIGVIVLMFILYLIFKDKGTNALDWLRQIWRFGT